jgi:predicted N-acyltransferase
MNDPDLRFEWHDHMAECDRNEWSRLTGHYSTPLLDWGWLRALEDSGSVSPEQGWIPQHLTVWRGERMVGAAPLYVKTHSAGEFVFDYAWADVALQLGVPYYPKLVAMSPLTPAIGYRFLVDPAEDESRIVGEMLTAIETLCESNSLHGFSVLWPEAEFAALLRRQARASGQGEFTPWQHQHFRWERDGIGSFDDYLAVFNKNQRRNIRRERASMEEQGLRVETVRGIDAPDFCYETMYRYYLATNEQFGMWAALYLTQEFFELLPSYCPERVIFTSAWESGATEPVGMAMLLHKETRLVGRYWGAGRFVKNLHFNLCYYEPIDWAIRNGVNEFDPGMGSNHKVRRGFRAVTTSSLHSFADERMQLVMKMNIDKINRYEQDHVDQLNRMVPFANR